MGKSCMSRDLVSFDVSGSSLGRASEEKRTTRKEWVCVRDPFSAN